MKHIRLAKIDPFLAKKEIGDFVVDHVTKYNKSGCVIGLSGGIDSSVTAALVNDAFNRYNQNSNSKLELVGYILPSKINNKDDEIKGKTLAEFLDIRYEIKDLEPIIDAHRSTNPDAFQDKYHKGNMISRIRANVLNTFAATENKLVAGTGNKDEDYGVGYYTLFGDGAVHISPIGNLPKRLVYEMADFLGIDKKIIDSEPTAGLEPDQTDFSDLGYGYDLVELVVAGLDQGNGLDELPRHPQIYPLAQHQIDSYIKRYGHIKFDSVKQMINDIYDRHKIALEKAGLVSPKIAPVTLQVI